MTAGANVGMRDGYRARSDAQRGGEKGHGKPQDLPEAMAEFSTSITGRALAKRSALSMVTKAGPQVLGLLATVTRVAVPAHGCRLVLTFSPHRLPGTRKRGHTVAVDEFTDSRGTSPHTNDA